MKIEKNKWVAIHYTVKDENGTEIDSSVGKEPLGYLHGNDCLISGLENALEGKETGDKFHVTIQPKDAYGEFDPHLVAEIKREQFDFDGDIEIGMQFQAMTQQGPTFVHVVEVDDDKITIDANHIFAGKVLNFDVEVVEVREPTEEELNSSCGCGGGCGGCGGNCNGGCGGSCDGGCGGDCGDDGNCDCGNKK